MSISRRDFIKIGSISAALIAGNFAGTENKLFGQSSLLRGADIPPDVYGDSLFSYHADTFKTRIGSHFNLFAENYAETAVLVAVEETASKQAKKLRGKQIESSENFVLSFRVSNGEVKQATYTVIHGELGQFDLLLVPAQNAKGEFLLNAVINRL